VPIGLHVGDVAEHSDRRLQTSIMSAEQGTWACIGSVLNDPLFLEKGGGVVATASQDDGTAFAYGRLVEFLDQWVFGPRYERIVPGKMRRDEWYEYLASLGLVAL